MSLNKCFARCDAEAIKGDAITNWNKYELVLREKWKVLQKQCSTLTDLGCMLYSPVKKGKTHNLLDVDVNKDGYYRIRWPGTLDEPRFKKRKSRGKEYDQKYYPRKAMYLHHLGYLVSHRAPVADPKATWDFSHRCHDRACFSPDHIVYERHMLNLDRQFCAKDRRGTECSEHKPSCLFSKSRDPSNQSSDNTHARFKRRSNIMGDGTSKRAKC
jgi:hypothetical protein